MTVCKIFVKVWRCEHYVYIFNTILYCVNKVAVKSYRLIFG